MRLDRYFGGVPVRLRSPLPPHEIEQRVNAAATSSSDPFAFGVSGDMNLGRLHLRFQRGAFEYSAKPILRGRVSKVQSGSELDLLYVAPEWVMAFLFVWYAALLAVLLFISGPDWRIVALLAGPLVLSIWGTFDADENLDNLLAFLAEEAEAT